MRFTRFVKVFCVSIPVAVTLADTVGSVAKVDGTSMQPALNPKPGSSDYVFLSRWAVRNFELRRGDIVSLRSPREPNIHLIKRVIGLEGDIVETNGFKQALVDVPPGHCWLEGDHKGHSIDSNTFGPEPFSSYSPEIVACGWSGNTYIVNHKKECVRFVLDEPANNFVAGRFGPTHAPCFVYGTFRNRLVVYPKIRLPPLQPRTLTDQLQQPQWSEVREKLSRLLSSRSRSAEAGGGETTPEADASRDLAHSLRRLSIPLPQHSNPPSPGSAADAFHSSYPSLFPQISRLASRPVIDPRKAHETAELVRHLLYGRRSRRLRSKGRRSAARTAAQHQ